ncbi:MAG TPA: hypothetical protein CFH82_06495 [Sulfurospirillum sp. UBA12182]|nr:MAG TPA: hypothetical protein CFH82_06495 [Sulfurospirillum sp. UBA12182]
MSKEVGNQAEDRAVEYLQKSGYSIVTRNFYSRFGEIDIIAKKRDILHFIEVKYSKNKIPTERITSSKIRKIIKTIDFYMYNNSISLDYQIDALLISEQSIEMIENITLFD